MKPVVTMLAYLIMQGFLMAQTPLTVPPYVQLLTDSVESEQLINDLNAFLRASQQPNDENEYVLPNQKLETFILLDEFKYIEYSRGFKDAHFYEPYLTNVLPLDENSYEIGFSHIGVNDTVPILRASFKVLAHRVGKGFLFSSSLKRQTSGWKKMELGNSTFYYATSINKVNAEEYQRLAQEFDTKLGVESTRTHLYCTGSRSELLRLIGVDYKLDYNGRTTGVFSAMNGNEQLIVLGNHNSDFSNFDPHDLWHDRLSLVVSRRKVNKPVDEGCAYVYGGSWGLTWNDIFQEFETRVASNKESDWMEFKENPTNFADTQAEHLYVDYVINALLIQKIEKEKGFAGVWELLNCGPYEKGNANYYETLEKLTGITRKNYNKEIWKLIKEESKSQKG